MFYNSFTLNSKELGSMAQRSLETTEFEPVFTKPFKRHGTPYPAESTDYEVDVHKGKLITVRNVAKGRQVSFNIGDMAEYDSYNMSYYGPIIAITAKRVTIISRHDAKRHAQGEKVAKYSLDMNKFSFRNWNFDLNKTVEQNYETSLCI